MTNLQSPQLTFLICVYNEELALPKLVETYQDYWAETQARILFVNDGSTDQTLATLIDLSRKNDAIGYLNLARNFGKEQAISAGLSAIPDDQTIIVIDGDGQHTPDAVRTLLSCLNSTPSADIVFGVRESRHYQGRIDRALSNGFYKLINSMIRQPLDPSLGDFFVARHTILPSLKSFQDSKLFWKGIYSWIGFNRETVPIKIEDRLEGRSKFNLFRRITLAIDGIVWLTKAPLYAISVLGLVLALISFLFAAYFIIQYLITGVSVPGFYTIIVMQAFIGGVVMLGLGVIAMYLAVIYDNTSSKPGFIISPRSNLPSWKKPSQ